MSTEINAWQEEPNNGSRMSPGDLMQKLPNLLRLLGAAAVIIAMYSFLAKGWQSGNDTFRYLMMLGHSGVLAAIGLASGHWLKEGKGARLLLSLALVSVPANFAILGAFIFSQSDVAQSMQYPSYMAWSVDSMQTALMTSAGALLVLTPIIYLGFLVLARSMATKLSLLFLMSNAALLLPMREPYMIGLLVLGFGVLTLFFTNHVAKGQSSAKTQEGVTALALQFLPLAVLLGRSLWLYATDLFLFAVMAATFFLALRQLSYQLEPESRLRGVLDLLSMLSSLALGFWLSAALFDSRLLPSALVFPLSGLASTAMLIELATRSTRNTRFYHRLAVSVLTLGMLANLLIFNSVLAALSSIIVGMMISTYGYKHQQRSLFSGGIAMLLLGLAQQIYQAFHLFDLGSWASLALLGIASIVIASTLESKGGKFKPRFVAMKQKLNNWES